MMTEYDFVEISWQDPQAALPLLQVKHPQVTQTTLHQALTADYHLWALSQASHPVGVAGFHLYPHLSDIQRVWLHDLITVDEPGGDPTHLGLRSKLLERVCNRCFSRGYSEVAMHAPVGDLFQQAFLRQVVGQPFAVVYEWTPETWATSTHQSLTSDFRCNAINTPAEITAALPLLTHFHPTISLATLIQAMKSGYRLFGLWLDNQLCSLATLIQYPHLTQGTGVWLQDGMTLPIKRYREVASSLLHHVLNDCFAAGISTVSVHARIKNKRIHRFYDAAGGRYIADAYKWKNPH